jgi:predicted nuclease of restriction endonuclease-like (RecB) superfamily
VVTESDLEDALITHLQDFLLELGKGFCFEDRQKRMIIDDEYYFADLVFYNRILHCSVIVDLLCWAQHNNSYVAQPIMLASTPDSLCA